MKPTSDRRRRTRRGRLGLVVAVALATGLMVSCGGDPVDEGDSPATRAPTPTPTPTASTLLATDTTTEPAATVVDSPEPTTRQPRLVSTTTTAVSPFARPAWLGTRVLPLRRDGFGEIRPTPPELADRRFETIDHLAPPTEDTFVGRISAIPDEVLSRASWQTTCPVALDELRYLTVSHWGFDDRSHTGELIVNAAEANGVVSVFERLFDEQFPIEQMRVAAIDDITAPPTGDGNGTGSFVCRPVRGATKWSQHAYGLAIDINPFHNPYARNDVVLPELASAYVDRSRDLPGMIQPDSVVVEAFADIGWSWGGDWNSLKDWMHFSKNGL